MVGPRVDLRRVASSRLPNASFAYKYCKDGPETRGEGCRLGFLSSSCRVRFSSSFILYFHFVFRSRSKAELIQRKIED